MSNACDSVLLQAVQGQSRIRKLATAGVELGTIVECPKCNDPVELREYTSSYGRTARYWSDCTCLGASIAALDELKRKSAALQVQQRVEGSFSDTRAIQHLTLDKLDASRMGAPYDIAVKWLAKIGGRPVADSYHNGIPAALFFYSRGKGLGKTHLAAAIALEAQQDERTVAFADEVSYIETYWAADLEAKKHISALPAQAWLTVLDDLGQRESTPAGLRDAWYDVINPRWLKRGWTVITSNKTPDELLAHGTINEATYSRLQQMTQRQVIEFTGSDYRLQGRMK